MNEAGKIKADTKYGFKSPFFKMVGLLVITA